MIKFSKQNQKSKNMYVNTVLITSKGQICIPKKVREFIGSNMLALEVTEDQKIILVPIKNVAGSLSEYSKGDPGDFNSMREEIWKQYYKKHGF